MKLAEKGLPATSRNPFLNYSFRVLKADLIVAGNSDEALQLLELSPPEAPEGKDSAWYEIAARRKAVQGLAYAYKQDFQNAELRLTEARQIAESNRLGIMGKIASLQGYYFAFLRHDEEAGAKHCREAIELSLQYKQPWYEVDARVNLGLIEMKQERYDEAIEQLSQALGQAQALHASIAQQAAMGNLGWSYYQLGDFNRAVSFLVDAQKLAALIGRDEDQKDWSNDLGNVYLDQKDYEDAEKSYSTALEIAKRVHNTDNIVLVLHNRAQLELERNNLEKAKEHNELALFALRDVSDSDLKSRCSLTTAEIATRQNQFEKAEPLLRGITESAKDSSLLWRAQSDLANLYVKEKKVAEADREFEAALQTVEDARGRVKQEEKRMSILDTWPFYDDYIHFLVHQNDARKALQIAEFSRARTLAEGLGIVGPQKSGQISIQNIRSLLARQNEAILAYWLADEESFLWLITPSQFKVYLLPPRQEIEQEIQAYTQKILSHAGINDSSHGQKLYQFLVRPAEKLIPRGTHVIVIPNRGLHKLNFETLVVPGPRPHYWIDDVTVQVAGSIALLTDSTQTTSVKAGNLLLIGSPVQASQEFGVLVHAPEEIQKIRIHFPPALETIISQAAAAPSVYKASQPERYRFIHFVTHGTAIQTSPLDSAIILSPQADGVFKLYARDIVGIPVKADVVTISACYGAGTRTYSGEGLVGLAWAFLRAGAHGVVAGLWEVDDHATPDLMDNFYSALKYENTATALREAKLKMLHSTSIQRLPYYWASLQLYTGSQSSTPNPSSHPLTASRSSSTSHTPSKSTK